MRYLRQLSANHPLLVTLLFTCGALSLIDGLRLLFNVPITLAGTLGLAFLALFTCLVMIRKAVRLSTEQREITGLVSTLEATVEPLGVAVCSVVETGAQAEHLAAHTCRFFGLPTTSKATFKDLLGVIYPDDLDDFLAENETFFEQPLEEGSVRVRRVEFRIRRPAGELRWVSAERVVALQNGERSRFVIYRDIQDERDLASKLKQIAEASESNLLAVSHEIRTPLNAIVGLTALLLDTRLNKLQNDYVLKISGAADTLEFLIRNLLDLSRLDSGQLLVEPVVFNTEALLEQISPLHQVSADMKGLRFLVDISPKLPTAINTDRQMLVQILNNLIRNAVKFTDAGLVMVSASYVLDELQGPTLRLEVSDTGPGIDPKDQESVFERFNRGAALNRMEGSGLGLALVRNFTEALGGRVELESQLGVGSKFSVSVPVELVDASPILDPETLDSLSNRRVLVVERRNLVASHMDNQLSPWVRSVVRVENKEAALRALAESSYEVVILGHYKQLTEVARLKAQLAGLKDQNPKLIAVVSAAGSTEGLSDCADGLIVEPFSLIQFARIFGARGAGEQRAKARVAAPDRASSDVLLNLRVLVAEDNEINQQVVKEQLRSHGAVVRVASDGFKAIEALQKEEFDIVLMDIEMPYLDGLGAAERIKSQVGWKDLPIIALSAGITAAQKERAKQAGMCDFVAKPYKLSDLSHAIENALRSRGRESDPLQPGLFEVDSSSREAERVFTEIDLGLAEEYWPNSSLLVQNLRRFQQMYPDASQLFDMNDIEAAQKMTHTLKGATGFLGMPSYSTALSAYNDALKQGTATREMCEGLIQQHTRVLNEIEAYLADLG